MATSPGTGPEQGLAPNLDIDSLVPIRCDLFIDKVLCGV